MYEKYVDIYLQRSIKFDDFTKEVLVRQGKAKFDWIYNKWKAK